MSLVHEHLKLLGCVVKDKITGFEGVVATVSFDLYGCIQAVVNPGVDKEGKLRDQVWFDVNRLKVLGKGEMEPPDFVEGRVAEGLQGPAEKPKMNKV